MLLFKSQQDLTLDELEGPETKDEGKKAKSRGRSRSPDREPVVSAAFKSEKSTPYAVGGKATNAEAANTADEIFQKFGIAFSFGNEDGEKEAEVDEGKEIIATVNSIFDPVLDSPKEDSCLLPGQSEYENQNFVMDESEFGDSVKTSMSRDASVERSPSPETPLSYHHDDEFRDHHKDRSKHHHGNHKVKGHGKKDKAEPARYLISGLSLAEENLDQRDEPDQYPGQVSPVYIEDPSDASNSSGFPSTLNTTGSTPDALGATSALSSFTEVTRLGDSVAQMSSLMFDDRDSMLTGFTAGSEPSQYVSGANVNHANTILEEESVSVNK